MLALVDEAIKQIALEGPKGNFRKEVFGLTERASFCEGCSLSRLWSLVEEELPLDGCRALVPEIKTRIWTGLLQLYAHDFGIYVLRQATADYERGCEPREALENQGSDRDDAAPSDDEKRAASATKVLLPIGHPLTKDLAFLEASSSATLIAVEECRFHFLGICDAVTSRFKLSEKQIETLTEIGRSRRKGCLQSDLARSVHVAHKNFFFVMKQLEGRQLAVRNAVILNRGEEADTHVSATNIIHLPMFAPDVKLTQFQAFKMVGDSEMEEGDEEGDASAYKMRDDASWMRQISEKISHAKNRIALEFDVKRSLGFRHTKGHRMWRRLKKKMVDLELIKSFVASVEGKAAVCLELLQEDFDEWLEGQKQQEMAASLKGPESCILADVSLNRQLFQMIVAAGHEGITTKDLFQKLHLNSKRNMYRLKAMENLFGIQIRTEVRGRSSMNKCFAPAGVLQEQMTEKDSNSTALPTLAALSAGWTSAAEHPADLEGSTLQEERINVAQSKETAESMDARSAGLVEDESPPAIRSFLSSHLVASKSDFRSQHLLEKIQRNGFILRSHVGAYLLDLEVVHGLSPSGKTPDRKTLDRVIDRLINEEKIKKMKVSMLTKSGGQPKVVDVLIQADLQVTEAVLRQIRESSEVFATTSRQRCQPTAQSELQQAHAASLPVLNDLTRLAPPTERLAAQIRRGVTEQGAAFQRIHRNGFVNARMTRAKLLHYHICWMVGLGGCDPAEGMQRSSEARFPRLVLRTARSSRFTDTVTSESKTYRFARQSSQVKQEMPSVGSDHIGLGHWEYSFTPRQLWDTFPVNLYLQVVGSSKDSEEEISLVAASDLRMDQVPEERLEVLVDRLSRSRLADLLDLLCRLRLIESSITANETGAGLMESSRFIAQDYGILEEMEVQEKQRVRCDLTTAEGLEEYWLRMEFGLSQQRQLADVLFPATVAPEVCPVNNWSCTKTMPTAKWLTLQDLMDEMEPLDWKKCKDIASRMNIAFQQVVRTHRDRCRKKLLKGTDEPKKRSRSTRRRGPSMKKRPSKKQKKSSQRREAAISGNEQQKVESEPSEAKDEKLRTGFWYRAEDVDLLSGYYAWLTSSKPSKSGARWTAMVGLPGGASPTALHRCKRRLRYLQRQEHLKELFAELEAATSQVYQQRWNRVMGSGSLKCHVVPERAESAHVQKRKRSSEKSLPSEIHEDAESEAVGMEVFHLNPLLVKGRNAIDVLLRTCCEEDMQGIQRMKELISEIAEKGPRMVKKEVDPASLESTMPRPRPLPEFVDLGSSVVSVKKRTKMVGLCLPAEDLKTEVESLSLPAFMAKDFILSCLYAAHKNRFLTKDMAKEMTRRFKDEELQKALSVLYKQGWINPGSWRYPMNLSPAFKKKLHDAWLPAETLLEAQTTQRSLTEAQPSAEGREYDADSLTTGGLLTLLSATLAETVTLSEEGLLKEGSVMPEGGIKIMLPMTLTPQSDATVIKKKKEGVRRTFAELLRESEMDEEMCGLEASETGEAVGVACDAPEMSSVQQALLDVVAAKGDEGTTLQGVMPCVQKLQLTEKEIRQQLESLVTDGHVCRFPGLEVTTYLSRAGNERFFFSRETEGAAHVIRPWRDYLGQIHSELLAKMQLHVLSTVLERPGICEADLVETLSYCSPHSALELCQAMTKADLIRTEHAEVVSPAALIPTCLRPKQDQTRIETVYFTNLDRCFAKQLPITQFLETCLTTSPTPDGVISV